MDSLKTASGFPGATFAIVFNADKKLSIATGLSNLEENIIMKPEDRLFTGSSGKTFVATIILQLIEEGKLNLDDPVSKYLGNEIWFSRLANHTDIKIKNLLNHTGGIPRYVFKEEFWKQVKESPDRIWQPAELLSFIFDDPPLHPTGKGWAYSDTDYIVLGIILEKICGNSYYDELHKRILMPLKLNDIIPSNQRNLKGLIQGYTGDNTAPFFLPGKVLENGKYVINPQFEWTGGGLISTSLDLATWAKKLYEGELFSEQMLDEMLSPVNYRSGQPDSAGYGLGVQIFRTPHGIVYGHSGIFPGYETQLLYFPKFKCGMAIQINADQFSSKLKGNLFVFMLKFLPIIEKYLN